MSIISEVNFRKEFMERTRKIFVDKNEIDNYEFTQMLLATMGMLFPVKEAAYNSHDKMAKYKTVCEIIKSEIKDSEIKEDIERDEFRQKRFWIKNKKGGKIDDIEDMLEKDFLNGFRNSFAHLKITPINKINDKTWVGVELIDYPYPEKKDREKDGFNIDNWKKEKANFYLFLSYEELKEVLSEISNRFLEPIQEETEEEKQNGEGENK